MDELAIPNAILPAWSKLQKAIAELEGLPDADQEDIGRKLLSHVEKLRRLRADVEASIASLDAGKGRPLDIEQFIRKMNRSDGRS